MINFPVRWRMGVCGGAGVGLRNGGILVMEIDNPFYRRLCASEFCGEWDQVGIDAYIPQQKYQVKPHLSMAYAAIVYRSQFFSFLPKG